MQNAALQHEGMVSAEFVGIIRRRGQPVNADVLNLGQEQDRSAEDRYESQKVEKTRLSPLARWIVLNAGDGIERGKIAEAFFQIPRFYCGYYVDPCLTSNEKNEHAGKYRKAQPLITKTLLRLQQLGLVELVKHGKCVKEIRSTTAGRAVAEQLVEDGDTETDKA